METVAAEKCLSLTLTVKRQIVVVTSQYVLVMSAHHAVGIVAYVIVVVVVAAAVVAFAEWRKKPAFSVLCPSRRLFRLATVGSIPYNSWSSF